MSVIEDTQRVSIAQIRALPSWPEIKKEMAATIVVEDVEGQAARLIALTTDRNNIGVRYWFVCPRCRSKRRHLFLTEGELLCRRCAKLLYYVQRLPDSTFRRDVAVPLLRQRLDHGATPR